MIIINKGATALSTGEKLQVVLFWAAPAITADHDPAVFSYLAKHVCYPGLICCLTLVCAVCSDLTADWLTTGPGGSSLGSQISRRTCQAFQWPCWVYHAPAAAHRLSFAACKGSQASYLCSLLQSSMCDFRLFTFLVTICIRRPVETMFWSWHCRAKLPAEGKTMEAIRRLWLWILHSWAWRASHELLLRPACKSPGCLSPRVSVGSWRHS